MLSLLLLRVLTVCQLHPCRPTALEVLPLMPQQSPLRAVWWPVDLVLRCVCCAPQLIRHGMQHSLIMI